MKKYKATFTINASWVREIEALDKEEALEIANNDEKMNEICNQNNGYFGVYYGVEEIK